MSKLKIPKNDDIIKKNEKFKFNSHIGKIPSLIGTGDQANKSIAYLTIKYIFITCGAMSLLYIAFILYSERAADKEYTFFDVLKIWDLFLPIITLIIGYLFGKREKGEV